MTATTFSKKSPFCWHCWKEQQKGKSGGNPLIKLTFLQIFVAQQSSSIWIAFKLSFLSFLIAKPKLIFVNNNPTPFVLHSNKIIYAIYERPLTCLASAMLSTRSWGWDWTRKLKLRNNVQNGRCNCQIFPIKAKWLWLMFDADWGCVRVRERKENREWHKKEQTYKSRAREQERGKDR